MAIGSVLIGLGPFLVEHSGVGAEANTFYRLLIGTIFFLGFRYKQNLKSFPLLFVLISCLTGLLLFLDLYLCNKSVILTSPGIATVLSNLEIIFLIILGKIFFKESPPKGFLLLCPVALIGIFALVAPLASTLTSLELLGLILAVSASISYGLYLFFMKYALTKHPDIHPESLLALACLSGCAILGIYMAYQPENLFLLPTTQAFSSVIINGIITQVIGWWLISKSIRHISLSFSGIILLLQPAVTYFIDNIVFNRSAHFFQIIGVLILLITIYFIALHHEQKEEG